MSGVEPLPSHPTAQSRAAVLAALSDVVTVTDPNNTDAAPKPLAPAPVAKSGTESGGGFGSRVAGAFGKLRVGGGKKGGRGQDGAGSKGSGNGASDAKGPSRIDVIDRLDASGLHGMSLFHHDSPYDACSPHSNRHGARAPVNAFSLEEGIPGVPANPPRSRNPGGSGGAGRQNLSPLAQATLQRMNAADAELYAEPGSKAAGPPSSGARSKPPAQRSRTMDSYNSVSTPSSDEKPAIGRTQSSTSDFSTTGPPTLAYGDDKGRGPGSRPLDHLRSGSTSSAASSGPGRNGYITAASAYPTHERSDQSNPLAEVWGIVPEPWQEFATPAAPAQRSGKSGRQGNSRTAGGAVGANGGLSPYGDGHESGTPSAASSVLDMEAVLTGKTSSSKTAAADTSGGSGGVGHAGIGSTAGGTIRRAGGRNPGATLDQSVSGGVGADLGVDGNGIHGGELEADNSDDFVISAGVSPFPEPDYGGPPRDADDVAAYGAYGGAGGAGPKRSKSLIKRMKSARQNPNMPALKLDTSNVELNSMGGKRSGHSNGSSPITQPTPTGAPVGESRRLRHLSSPVLASPGGGSRAGPLAPQWEEQDGGSAGGGGNAAAAATTEGDDYIHANRGYKASGGGGGGAYGAGAGAAYSPGTPGGGASPGSGLTRNGSLFSKFGRKGRA